jgi:hypothetical protein
MKVSIQARKHLTSDILFKAMDGPPTMTYRNGEVSFNYSIYRGKKSHLPSVSTTTTATIKVSVSTSTNATRTNLVWGTTVAVVLAHLLFMGRSYSSINAWSLNQRSDFSLFSQRCLSSSCNTNQNIKLQLIVGSEHSFLASPFLLHRFDRDYNGIADADNYF